MTTNTSRKATSPFRPHFTFTGKMADTGKERTIRIQPCAWAVATFGGNLAGARGTLRISPSTMLFMEKSVKAG